MGIQGLEGESRTSRGRKMQGLEALGVRCTWCEAWAVRGLALTPAMWGRSTLLTLAAIVIIGQRSA